MSNDAARRELAELAEDLLARGRADEMHWAAFAARQKGVAAALLDAIERLQAGETTLA